MEPIVNRAKKKYESKLRGFEILNIRTEKGEKKIEEYGISYTPTFLILDKNDKEISRYVGEAKEEIFFKFIEEKLKN